jgi:anti-sigma regulatory factor (Ser/Thr protein kinase)
MSGLADRWALPESVAHDATLAVSELVTNAVLHAHTPLRLRLARRVEGVRIEVADDDPRLPPVEQADPARLALNRSMTGRGLALVAAVADGLGAERQGRGKVTWAEVGTGRPGRARRGSARRAPPPKAGPTASRRGITADGRPGWKVELRRVPVRILLESTVQLSDLQREMQVMALDAGAGPELTRAAEAARAWMADIDRWTDSDRRFAEAAAAAGAEVVDFEVVVPDDVAARIEGIASWLDGVAAPVQDRQLLTLPATAEVVAYRRWYGAEIIRQLSGHPPTGCPLAVDSPRPPAG